MAEVGSHRPREQEASEESRPLGPLGGKTTRALLTMAALLAIPYTTPRLRALRVVRAPWDKTADAVSANGTGATPSPSVGDQALGSTENRETVTNALPASAKDRPALDAVELAHTAGSLAVEDPTGHALDRFYEDLVKTDRKEAGAVTRILHYGDSVITGDLVSGTMRRKMQERFGDAGHGFILTANAWEWYFHNDVRHSASEGWNANRITGPWTGDGMYGLGGVSFHTSTTASAWFATANKGDYGLAVSRFDVYYVEQPSGGSIDVVVPGQKPTLLSTRGTAKASRVFSVNVPDGAGSLSLRTRGDGDVRVFGVALERDVPGVVYDALGANGARAILWDQQKTAHWHDQMELRKPALVILQYGTNETEAGVIDPEAYEKQLGSLIEKVKEAAPEASILVAAPLDRAEKGEDGKLKTRAILEQLVTMQRAAALAHGVAFWNTFEAMGGRGTFARWVKASPQLASWDLTHPTPEGAEVIGDLLYKALTTGYDAYASRQAKR